VAGFSEPSRIERVGGPLIELTVRQMSVADSEVLNLLCDDYEQRLF
jgi:hypothetical protein